MAKRSDQSKDKSGDTNETSAKQPTDSDSNNNDFKTLGLRIASLLAAIFFLRSLRKPGPGPYPYVVAFSGIASLCCLLFFFNPNLFNNDIFVGVVLGLFSTVLIVIARTVLVQRSPLQVKRVNDPLFSHKKFVANVEAAPSSERQDLRNLLNNLDTNELKDVVFRLEGDWDNLQGDVKSAKILSMIQFYTNGDRIDKLKAAMLLVRPDLGDLLS